MKGKRKAYEEKLEAQLKEWSAQVALLKAKADNARADAKIEYYKIVDTLQHKQKKPGLRPRPQFTKRPRGSNERGC